MAGGLVMAVTHVKEPTGKRFVPPGLFDNPGLPLPKLPRDKASAASQGPVLIDR